MKPILITEHCISKVHDELRKVKPECYKPVAVSIGPYYHIKCDPDHYPGLEAMQQFKELYLNSLLERRNKSLQRRNERLESRENYLSKLAELETKTRECYADPMSTIKELCSSEFTEMMLLDSCFVVEFIRKINYVPSKENDPIPDDVKAAFEDDDPIAKSPRMLKQIQRDMLLLENQLPYFVLSNFYDMTKYDGEKSLDEMTMLCFNYSLPRPRLYFSNSKGEEIINHLLHCEKINHLLHLVHIFCRPSAKEVGKSHNFNDNSDQNSPLLKNSYEDSVGSSNENNPKNNRGSFNRESYVLKKHIDTVVELQEAGVNFKKISEVYSGVLVEGAWNEYVSLFDIKFERGVMKIPCFKVDASTETFLRNLIAYEQQYFIDVQPKYFTDFAMLIDQLINSEEDTKVLRYKDIIINYLGDDMDVSQLFNSLIDGVCDSYESYFLEVRENVDKHCKTKRSICRAYLKRNCFKDLCVSTSTIAAAILLLLTVAQLIVALRD